MPRDELIQTSGTPPTAESLGVSEMVAELRRRAVPDVGQIKPDGVGPELFPPGPVPQVLAGHVYDNPVEVFEFFRRIDLLSGGETPSFTDLDPSGWDTAELEGRYGHLVVKPRGPRPVTGWAPDLTMPPLPESVRKGIPKISFSIWKGGVPSPDGKSALFWKRLADSALEHSDLKHVLVAAVGREEVRAAVEQSQPPVGDERAADVWHLVRHLDKHGIGLVDSRELYGPGHEMINGRAAAARSRRRNGTGTVVDTDILRLNLLYDYGGMYRDGNKLLPSTEVFQDVADSAPGFGYHEASGNGAFITFRGHPQFRAFLQETDHSYQKDQVALERDANSYQGNNLKSLASSNRNRRNSLMERTGPFTVARALINSGWHTGPTLSGTSKHDLHAPEGGPPLHYLTIDDPNQGSWMMPQRPRQQPLGHQEILDTIEDITASLVSDLSNKRGHLDLTEIEEALGALPAPKTALAAVLTFITSRDDLRRHITGYSATRTEIVRGEDGKTRTERTEFPHMDVVRRFLHPLDDAPSLIGDKEGWWLLHKQFTRAVPLRPGHTAPHPDDLDAAYARSRPDTFGLHRLPNDPWPSQLFLAALQHVRANLPKDQLRLASMALGTLAGNGRGDLSSRDWEPSVRHHYRATTARILGLNSDYDPRTPLPVLDEGRMLRLQILRINDEPLPEAVVEAVTRAIAHAHRTHSQPPVPGTSLGAPDHYPTDTQVPNQPKQTKQAPALSHIAALTIPGTSSNTISRPLATTGSRDTPVPSQASSPTQKPLRGPG